MPPTSASNLTAFMGAAVLGIVGAAAVYVIEHFRQEKRRHAMAQDLAKLNLELSVVKEELEKLMKRTRNKAGSVKMSRRRPISIATGTDYMTSNEAESSDLEFYDVSDRESISEAFRRDLTYDPSSLDKALKSLDEQIENSENLDECLNKLTYLCIEHPESPELLWRIAWAHYKISELTADQKLKREHIDKGMEASEAALKLNDKISNVHQWYAVLFGARSKLQPMKEKILDGNSMKKHVDIALELDPNNYILHHLSGRFCLEIAGLKWYERKVASALFATPPEATYEEALQHFVDADRLFSKTWNENNLCIAKCLIALNKLEEAVRWLEKATENIDEKEKEVNDDVASLLSKYKSKVKS